MKYKIQFSTEMRNFDGVKKPLVCSIDKQITKLLYSIWANQIKRQHVDYRVCREPEGGGATIERGVPESPPLILWKVQSS